MINKTEKTNKNIVNHSVQEAKSITDNNFAGSYKCKHCKNEIYFNNINQHDLSCPLNAKNEYLDDNSAMIFTLNEPDSSYDILKKSYGNEDFSTNLLQKNKLQKSIDDFFILSENVYQKIINKIENSNFKIKDLAINKTTSISNYFININPDIKEKLYSKQEFIYHDRIVIFEDVYHNTPVFRLSFHSLKNENFQIKFKVYANTQHPEIKKLYNQLLLIPSKYKKKVNNNSGHYTLGKSIFIRGVLKENSTNLYFTDIKDLWLCDADNKYDNILDIKNDS